MAEQTTWIKIDRNILNWRWYQDTNTKVVFLHLLLTANIKDHDFEMDTIHRGEVAISIGNLAKAVGITYDEARTAINHLKETNEIISRKRPKYLIITVLNYDKYQTVPSKNGEDSVKNQKPAHEHPTQTPSRINPLSIENANIMEFGDYVGPTQIPSKSQANPKQTPSESQQSKKERNKERKNNLNTATKVTVDLEDYGGIFLTGEQWAELEQAVGPGVLIEYVDKVAEWLEENPRQKKTHVNVLRKFLRNDGLIK